jgi:hypothetical protein
VKPRVVGGGGGGDGGGDDDVGRGVKAEWWVSKRERGRDDKGITVKVNQGNR